MPKQSKPSISILGRGEVLSYTTEEGTTSVDVCFLGTPDISPGEGFVWDEDVTRKIPLGRRLEIFEDMLIYLKDLGKAASVTLYEKHSDTCAFLKFCDEHEHLVSGVTYISNQDLLKRDYEDDLKWLIKFNRPLRKEDTRIETEEQLQDYYRSKGAAWFAQKVSG